MTIKSEETGRQTFFRLLGYLKPYRKKFTVAILAMVLYGATDGAIPFLIRSILDDIFGSHQENMLYLLPMIIVVFAVFRGVFAFLQQYLTNAIGLSIVSDLRDDLGKHLLFLSPSFYFKHQTGELISRVNNDTLLVRSALTEGVASILRDSVRTLSLAAAAIYLDPVLALLSLVAFPVGLFPMMKFGKKIRRHSRLGQEKLGGLTNILQEIIVGHRVVQAFSMEPYEQKRFHNENEQLTKSLIRAEKYGALSGPSNEFIAGIAISLVILYGGLSVISGVRTQGDFIAFIIALFLLYEPFKKLGRVNNAIQSSIAAAERIFKILDTPQEISDRADADTLIVTEPSIEIRNVSFRYNENDKEYALRDISLKVLAGEKVALVGMSGGGKSTLVNLLPRFFEAQTGGVFISKKDIRNVTLCSLRSAIGVVHQNTFLFNDTVFHNIAYGHLSAVREEVLSAARNANAHEFIMRLPNGYDTVIGEQGYRLSGGERARLSIARALLKNAPILILDEATAALDSQSELLVQEAIQRLMEGKTVLIIAHRLATVRHADKIVVMSRGKIVETGKHEQLLKQNGEYAKLYRLQFANEEEHTQTEKPTAMIRQ